MQLKKKSTKVFALVLSSIIISASFSGIGNAAKSTETYNGSKENVVERVNEKEDKESKNHETLNENKNLEDLSIKELTEVRDNEIDKNLEGLEKLEYTKDEIQERKKNILDPNCNFGLINFINNKYKNLTEKDKLIREINLVKYIDSTDEIMDAEGEYFIVTDQEYQISEYLLKNEKSSDLSSYKNLEFLIENIQDVSDNVNYNGDVVVEIVNPLIKKSISDSQKDTLIDELKEVSKSNSTDEEIKNEIQNIQNFSELDENNLDKVSFKAAKSSKSKISSKKILAYARKHGYTNGYYGSKNKMNDAPKPYYNFQKSSSGGDCANFVSQCLHAGGYGFKTGGEFPWYYYSLNKRSSAWCYARQFKLHWMRRVKYETVTVRDTLRFLKPGTPVSICKGQSGRAFHTLIATDRHSNGYNFSYAAHSDYGVRTNLLRKLKDKQISYYKANW